MSLTLKDLRVLFRHDDHPDDEVRGTLDYRPASLADLVNVLKQHGATIEVVEQPGYAEANEWVEPGSYLVFRLVDA